MHRFFVPAWDPAAETVDLPRETARQIAKVLRLRDGARIVLFSGDGDEAEATLDEGGAAARITERRSPAVELACRLHVAVAVLKGEKPEWLIQKLTEIGAARISFLRTERTVVDAGEERWARRLERYERIAREAAEQSGRVRVPELGEPRPLAEALAQTEERRFLDPRADQSLLQSVTPAPDAVTLLIGPEGGFSDREVAQARESGAQGVRLGARILRAETAAIVAAGIVAATDS